MDIFGKKRIKELEDELARASEDNQALRFDIAEHAKVNAANAALTEALRTAHAQEVVCKCGEVRNKKWTRCFVCGFAEVI